MFETLDRTAVVTTLKMRRFLISGDGEAWRATHYVEGNVQCPDAIANQGSRHRASIWATEGGFDCTVYFGSDGSNLGRKNFKTLKSAVSWVNKAAN